MLIKISVAIILRGVDRWDEDVASFCTARAYLQGIGEVSYSLFFPKRSRDQCPGYFGSFAPR
jgi:hypothetical protein